MIDSTLPLKWFLDNYRVLKCEVHQNLREFSYQNTSYQMQTNLNDVELVLEQGGFQSLMTDLHILKTELSNNRREEIARSSSDAVMKAYKEYQLLVAMVVPEDADDI